MKRQSLTHKKSVGIKYANSRHLFETGKLSHEWAVKMMKVITKITEKYQRTKPLANFKLGFCLHITKETSVLCNGRKSTWSTNFSLFSKSSIHSTRRNGIFEIQ